jgi:CHAD domain-containing protein
MTATASLERELKFALDLHATLPDLGPLVGETIRLPDQVLRTTYFDTSDLRLWERRITLRHRSGEDAENGTWTLKLPAESAATTLDRTELSWPGPKRDVPPDVPTLLRGLLRQGRLQEVVQLESTRRRVLLCDGPPLGELDDDIVTVLRGARKGFTFRQVELELEDGADRSHVKSDAGVITSVVKALRKAGAYPEDEPKFAKSIGLRSEPETERDESVEDVVHRCIVNGLGRLLDNDTRLRLSPSEPPREAVHQARVATRRLRSDLRTFASILDPVWLRRVTNDLQWIGTVLGSVRDIDVLEQRLSLSDPSEPLERVGREELSARLSWQRRDLSRHLGEALDSDRYLQLLGRLHAAVHALPVSPPPKGSRSGSPPAAEQAAEVLPGLVHTPWVDLHKKVKKAGRHPSDRQLHRIRIRAKRLRYAAEAAQPTVGRRARRTAKAAERLQTILGDHHDAVEAERWLRREGPNASAAGGFAAGLLTARQRRDQRRLKRRWRAVWQSLGTQKNAAWLR